MNHSTFEVRAGDPNDPGVHELLEALSETLASITGRDGKNSFAYGDVNHPGSVFLIAYQGVKPVGCGAIRPINEQVCELKRMYAHESGRGIGSRILEELERHAKSLGYLCIWLETGIQNERAQTFYLNRGYRTRENYGKYIGRRECVCFEKQI